MIKNLIFLLIMIPFSIFSQNSTNPFLKEWKTPFKTPPFNEIKNEHFIPAFQEGINSRIIVIESIINNPEPPTFSNTIDKWELSNELLDNVSNVFYSLLSANKNDELQKIAEEITPMLSKANDDINFNEKLFKRIKVIYENRDKCTPEQNMVVTNYYQDFIKSGVNLDETAKNKLRQINEELNLLYLKFGDNIMKETNAIGLTIEKKEDLEGLPESVINSSAELAKSKNLDGKWVFTLQRASFTPFLQYSAKRELRQKLFTAYISRGNNNNENDTKDILSKIMLLRVQKVNLLGYKTYADYRLESNMAKNSANVMKFLNELWTPALESAKKEVQEMQNIIDKEKGNFKLMPWDWWYYAEKVKKAKYDFDEEMLRPYFEISNVIKGVFNLSERLYGLKFVERKDITGYHPEVKVFEVKESNGKHLGILYTDYYPRDNKESGAWCGAFRGQSNINNKFVSPVITNCGNFSKPSADKPALLSFDEVETLFHEFGHALHGLFSNVKYGRGSGVRAVDFIELPSQIMENWVKEPEFLVTFAKHYKTGKPIPRELIEKVVKSGKFNQGFATVEYIAASLLDMKWHSIGDVNKRDVVSFENDFFKSIGKIAEIESRYQSTNFLHIFSGEGYPAGYYGYLWAEVLDSDAFQAFKETNLFNKKIAASFRKNILEKSGSMDPMEMYIKFRGREPKIDALLEKRGLK